MIGEMMTKRGQRWFIKIRRETKRGGGGGQREIGGRGKAKHARQNVHASTDTSNRQARGAKEKGAKDFLFPRPPTPCPGQSEHGLGAANYPGLLSASGVRGQHAHTHTKQYSPGKTMVCCGNPTAGLRTMLRVTGDGQGKTAATTTSNIHGRPQRNVTFTSGCQEENTHTPTPHRKKHGRLRRRSAQRQQAPAIQTNNTTRPPATKA